MTEHQTDTSVVTVSNASGRIPVYPPLSLLSMMIVVTLAWPIGFLLFYIESLLGLRNMVLTQVGLSFLSLTIWIAPIAVPWGSLFIWSFRGELERVRGLPLFVILLLINAGLLVFLVGSFWSPFFGP